MEIWTIKEDWSTLKTHTSIEEANNFVHFEAFQTLYRKGPDMPIHVFKNYK